ncbi:MAG: Xaa-Pro peptidase family protein [Granulosicoccus sp.]|nr:Xaa-Pro peptidase family protein [Granulosicoccus sp.]
MDIPDKPDTPQPDTPQPKRGFEAAEFEARLQQAQSRMALQNIDLLFLCTEPDVRYFSGFLTQFWQSPTRPWFLLVPQSGKPVAVIPSIGLECMSRTWIDDIRTWAAPHAEDDGVSLLHDTITELTGGKANVGLMMGFETSIRMPLQDLHRLQTSLPGIRWENASTLVQQLRQIKSENEINKIRFVAEAASSAFATVPQWLTTGMTESEVFRQFKISCLQYGVDDTAYLVGASGPGGYGDIISPPSNRKLSKGDVLIMDTGCIWDGYFCDFDRNFGLVQSDEATQTAYRIAWEATEAGLMAARPGATCSDLFDAMNTVMAPHAVESDGDVGRLGHGLGMQLTETPSHTSFDQTVLQPGMVLTLEPGFTYAAGKMMVHEENIVIREGGAELLSHRAEAELPVVG